MEKNLPWKKYYVNIETKNFQKKVKTFNELKIPKHITNMKNAICNYDGLRSK